MTLRAAVLIASALCGCPRVAIDRSDRPCTEGKCARGFVCHPETDTCAPIIAIGCGQPSAQCAWTTRAGDDCSPMGSFIPCVDGREDCRGGCRTCLDTGVWSTCSDPACELGQLWSCDRCDHDCRELVANAEPACDSSAVPSTCIYIGSCLGDWVDTDGDRGNGCECLPNGNEACNGHDDDCDGVVDNGAVCAGTAVCEDGTCEPCTATDPLHCGATCAVCDAAAVCEDSECVPCTAADPLHCGPTCQVCAGDSPICVDGGCACIEGSCDDGHFCDAGVCRTCADDDDDHCGADCLACAGETDTCADGSCQCVDSSCNPGRWCDRGACQACDVSDHCGSSCVQCSPATPVCAAGLCQCTTGSCPSGQYCDSGTCTACSCSSLFPTCADQGDAYLCRCSAASCGEGGNCEDDDSACVYADSFDTGTNLLHVCSDSINNSWAMREGTAGICRSTPNCWATNPDGDYNNCELSCIESPTLNTSGATSIEVSFWVWYQLEEDYDGVTPRFADTAGWQIVTPSPNWDVGEVILGGSCSGWPYPSWPAFGQYSTSSGIGWTQIRFAFDSAASPGFFHSGFAWRIYLETDEATTHRGMWVDDVEVRVTQTP